MLSVEERKAAISSSKPSSSLGAFRKWCSFLIVDARALQAPTKVITPVAIDKGSILSIIGICDREEMEI